MSKGGQPDPNQREAQRLKRKREKARQRAEKARCDARSHRRWNSD